MGKHRPIWIAENSHCGTIIEYSEVESNHRILDVNKTGRMRWLQAGPEVQQLLRKGWVVFRHTGAWEPPTDVYENEVGLVVQVEIAGMQRDDFTIALRDRMLVIAGVRSDTDLKRAIHQMEIHYGEFRAEIYLPWLVDSDDVEAAYEDGFLRVLLPRPLPRRLQVVDGSEDQED